MSSYGVRGEIKQGLVLNIWDYNDFYAPYLVSKNSESLNGVV